MKSVSKLTAAVVATLGLVIAGSVTPVSATSISPQAVTVATGGENCSGNQKVVVNATTSGSTGLTFYRKTGGKYSKVYFSNWGDTHTFNYGTASASWKVQAHGGTIKTVSDYCSAASRVAE